MQKEKTVQPENIFLYVNRLVCKTTLGAEKKEEEYISAQKLKKFEINLKRFPEKTDISEFDELKIFQKKSSISISVSEIF